MGPAGLCRPRLDLVWQGSKCQLQVESWNCEGMGAVYIPSFLLKLGWLYTDCSPSPGLTGPMKSTEVFTLSTLANISIVIAKLILITKVKFLYYSWYHEYIHEQVLWLNVVSMIMINTILNWCINYISGQTLVLIICVLISIFTGSLTDSGFHPDSGHPKVVLTVIFVLTVVSSLSDHFYAIFISAYFAVWLKIYAHGNMPGRSDLITANKLTHYLPERKAIAASL